MKKNVSFLLGDGVYPYRTGGMEIFNYFLIKELRSSFNIHYLSNKPLNYNDCKWYKIRNLKPIKLFYPLQLFTHFLFHPNHKTVVISFASAHWFLWFFEYLIIKIFRLKSICVIHSGDNVPNDHIDVYKKFFQSQFCVIAVSDDIKRNYDKAFYISCKTIPPLVPFSKPLYSNQHYRNKYNIPFDSNVICMVGSIKSMKNPDTLINAIASMSPEQRFKYKPFALYAGSGPMLSELIQYVHNLNIEENVKFLGNIPKDNINEILSISNIYLIASDYEGTSVSLLEAMYNKKTIICSRVPGLIDMVREGIDALFFSLHSSEELKNLIIRLLANPNEANQIAESAFTRYQNKYSYQQMINNYIMLLS